MTSAKQSKNPFAKTAVKAPAERMDNVEDPSDMLSNETRMTAINLRYEDIKIIERTKLYN